jgi:SAM-dependent methyltransferase
MRRSPGNADATLPRFMPNADRISELYKGELWGSAQRRAQARIHWLVAQARGSVLDVGCSQGIASILCAREGLSVVGIDNEDDRLAYANADRDREPAEVQARLRFAHADASKLEFPDSSFDTVLFGEVLEHLADPAPVLEEVSRVMKPDGVIALTTPFGFSPHQDHRATFYVGSLLDTLAPHLAVESVEVVDGYFRVRAGPGATDDQAKLRLIADLQGELEALFLQTELEGRRWKRKALRRHAKVVRLRRQVDRRGRKARRARQELRRIRARQPRQRLRDRIHRTRCAVARLAQRVRPRIGRGSTPPAVGPETNTPATSGRGLNGRGSPSVRGREPERNGASSATSTGDNRLDAVTRSRRRWIIHGDIRSRYAVESLITALRAADQDVVEVPAVARGHHYHRADHAEARRRIDAALPADVLFNFRPEAIGANYLRDLSSRGVTTAVWFADDPLLYKVCYRHVVEAYDLTLHTGREDVLRLYEDRHGVRGYAFPFWTDAEHHPNGYDPELAEVDVGFLGNCSGKRRSLRYDLLAGLPWRVRFYGRLPIPGKDPAGIHGGYLELEEIPDAIRSFRIGLTMAQNFVQIRDRYSFRALDQFGEFFFPSRLVMYAASGIPTISLGRPGAEPPFPSVFMVGDRDELVSRVESLLGDPGNLMAASARAYDDFRTCLSADSRVAMLHCLLDGTREHDRPDRAELWREFPPAESRSTPAQLQPSAATGDG